jgi:hypothetical protein
MQFNVHFCNYGSNDRPSLNSFENLDRNRPIVQVENGDAAYGAGFMHAWEDRSKDSIVLIWTRAISLGLTRRITVGTTVEGRGDMQLYIAVSVERC